MPKLTYTGDAPGQSEQVRIGAVVYCRGEIYTVTEDLAKVLARKGGFVLVKKQKKESKK